MDSAERTRLRRQAMALPVSAQVGKAALTDPVVEEIRRQVLDKRLVKVRLLATAGDDPKAMATALAESVGAELVEVRGHTAVLWRTRSGSKK